MRSIQHSKWEVRALSKRDDILTATFELIHEIGLQSVTFAKIFKRAGVGSGTVYNYFQSKEALVNELFLRFSGHMSETVKAGYRAEAPLFERFSFFLNRLADYAVQCPRELAFLENFAHSPYLSAETKISYKPEMAEFFDIFTEGQRTGVFQLLDPMLCVEMTMGVVISAMRSHLSGKYPMTDSDRKRVVEAAWRCVKL
jgi:AcrR family transcriptional regulator